MIGMTWCFFSFNCLDIPLLRNLLFFFLNLYCFHLQLYNAYNLIFVSNHFSSCSFVIHNLSYFLFAWEQMFQITTVIYVSVVDTPPPPINCLGLLPSYLFEILTIYLLFNPRITWGFPKLQTELERNTECIIPIDFVGDPRTAFTKRLCNNFCLERLLSF